MHFNPRAPCGARRSCASCREYPSRFQPTRPLRGATDILHRDPCIGRNISTHAPLAGRDLVLCGGDKGCLNYFNPRAPCGARRYPRPFLQRRRDFNPRAPCGARLVRCVSEPVSIDFNPRAPCGARRLGQPLLSRNTDFNPRAPCGARQQKCTNHYAHFCDNRQIPDVFAQNADCQGILFLFCARKTCKF